MTWCDLQFPLKQCGIMQHSYRTAENTRHRKQTQYFGRKLYCAAKDQVGYIKFISLIIPQFLNLQFSLLKSRNGIVIFVCHKNVTSLFNKVVNIF